MSYESIILEKEEGIATIALNRPERRNALIMKSREELLKAIEDVNKDEKVKVLVITGVGKAFCAGTDVEDISSVFGFSSVEFRERLRRGTNKVILELRGLEKPTIASVNGVAVGAGLNLALACDIRIASEKARFGGLFMRMGVIPDWGGTYFLPRLVGSAKACELIFTGDIIDAKEAERIGLVNKVVPAGELETATKQLAGKLAKGPSIAMGMAKMAIYRGLEWDLASQLEFEAYALSLCAQTQDHKEAVKAFFEKREPIFTGK